MLNKKCWSLYFAIIISLCSFISVAQPIPISCDVGSLPSLAHSDDFAQLNNGWKTVDFNRAISNWPNDTIFQSSGENQQVTAVVTGGRLAINGAVTIGGDNEYGMVRNELEEVGINEKVTNNYAVAIDLTADKVGLNNDVGLVFGYINDSNYYLARWTKYGTGYVSDTSFPGTYRRLELIKVSNGVVSSLGFKDNFDVNDPFNLKVVVNTQGTAVCVNDVAQLYSATEQPIIQKIGIFSYDNDDGVFADNLAVYCNNCRIVKPVAEYRFDECYFTGNVGDVADKNKTYPATSFGGVAITTNGQIQNAANFSHYSHHIETSVPLPASFSLTTWFKKPTSTTDSKFFVLASLQSNGDILYIDRSNGWKWGVFTASPFGTTNGTYSFASLDNNWHHLGLVSAGGQTKLFIDGVLVDSVNRTVTGTFKYIGTSFESINTVNAQSFRAPLDEFSIYHEILTAGEINTIYQNQLLQKDFEGKVRKTKICNGLLGLYSFEQTSFAANIIDSSANLKNAKNKGGISIAAGKFCRAFDTNGNNSTSNTSNAFKSGLDMVKDVGIKGSVSFWYKSNSNWNAGGFSGGERVLFDASKDKGLGVINKYFYLGIKSDGRLSFAFEDSIDGDYRLDEPVSSVRTANTWYYVSTTWNFATNTYQLYVDGNLLSSQFINTNGAIKDLGKIIFGDNASKYAANGDVFLPSYTSANGQFDEVRIYNKVLNQAEIQADMNNGGSCSNLDHFEIIHDGNGLTCAAETVTIKACTNTNCSTLSTNAVTLNFQGNAVTKSSTTFTGSTTVSFNHAVAETLALSVANPTIAPTNVLVCSNGSTNSCNMIFADTGFRFLVDGAASNIPTQLSGKPSNTGYHSANLALQAIKTNPTTGACEAALTSSVVVEVAAKCTNPTSCAGQVVNINGVNINTLNNNATLSYSNLTFDFGNNVTNSAAFLDSTQPSTYIYV